MNIPNFQARFDGAERTTATYSRYLRYLKDWMGDRELETMTVKDFNQYLEDQLTWSSRTRHLALAAVKAYLGIFQESHPLRGHNVRRGASPPQRAYTPEIMERLIRSVDTRRLKGIRDLALLLTMYDTGLRATEICKLLMRHLDLKTRVLRAHVKGDRWRSAAFSRRTAKALAHWIEVRDSDSLYVFLNMHQGEPLTREGLQYIVREWGKQVGIPLSPHDIRRSYAVNMLRAGAPAQIVMAQGGWRSPTVFQRYVQTLMPADAERWLPTMTMIGEAT